jgi:hypothetical protein
LLLVAFARDVRVGLLASLAAILVAETTRGRRALAVAAWSVLFGVVSAAPRWADLVLVHAHNLVAVAVWWRWRRRRTSLQLVAVLAAAAIFAALLAGVFDPFVSNVPLAVPGSVNVARMAFEIAPLRGALAYHLLLAFVFAQGVHYVVWLRLVPEDDRPKRAPRPFAASGRALLADFGPTALVVAGALALLVVLRSLGDIAAARSAYLAGAVFHAHLEIALLILAELEGRRPGEASPCSAS